MSFQSMFPSARPWRRRFCTTVLLLVVAGCGKPAPKPPSSLLSSEEAEEAERVDGEVEVKNSIHFTSLAKERGLDFTYTNGAKGDVLMVESTGGGGGWLDYDVDGRPDLYLCQGSDPTAPINSQQPNDALFRATSAKTSAATIVSATVVAAPGSTSLVSATPANEAPSKGVAFANAASPARIEEFRYGQGVAIGDYNDDGFDDVYVTNVGRNTLWRNMGDGTFLDVTDEAGVGDERWSSSAAFADLDQDGDLDLYCCNYCIYDVHDPIICRDTAGKRRTCHPKDVAACPDECYFNQGDGTFKPESQQRGLFGPGNKALGVVIADFDVDGDPDIYVANDTTENFYFDNDGNAKFKEVAQRKGCAVNRNGIRQASMGLAFGDFDRDGWQDLYSTHFFADSNTLYRNLGGRRGFEDVTGYTQLHEPTLPYLGFGSVMQDFDQNGTMELLVANGHVDSEVSKDHYAMRPQLFTFRDSVWHEIEAEAGDYFAHRFVGRGVATADYDDDGDLDAVVINQNSPVTLLENVSQRGASLKLTFRGRSANRRGIGCRVIVETKTGAKYTAELCGGSSYTSTMQPCLVVGLGKETGPLTVIVQWPGGGRQILKNVNVNESLIVEQESQERPDASQNSHLE